MAAGFSETRSRGQFGSTSGRTSAGGQKLGVSNYGNEFGVRPGGSSIATESRKQQDHIAKYAPFFGQLTQEMEQNPYDDYPRDTFTLPEAYRGPNVYLRRILATWISEADQWPIREMLPWKAFDGKMQIEWEIWSFDDHMLERVPERSAGRLLTSRKESHQDYMVRYGIALLLDHEFADMPDGAECYRKNLLQIVNASIETFCHGAMMAVMDDKAIGVPKRHLVVGMDDNSTAAIEERMRQDMSMWAIVQTTENGLQIAIDRCEATLLARLKRSGDYCVLPRGVSKYVKQRPENRYYFIAGPSTGGNRQARRDGLTMREGRRFRVGAEQPDVDPMESERTIGGFFCFDDDHIQSDADWKTYKTSFMDTRIFSETHDDWYIAKYSNALLKCGLFKAVRNKWEFGPLGAKIFTKEGDLTVGEFLTGVDRLDPVVQSIMSLDVLTLWNFIKDVTSKYQSTAHTANIDSKWMKGNKFPASLLYNSAAKLDTDFKRFAEEPRAPRRGRRSDEVDDPASVLGRPYMRTSARPNIRSRFMESYDTAATDNVAIYNRRLLSAIMMYNSGSGTRTYRMGPWLNSLSVISQSSTLFPFEFVKDVGSSLMVGNRTDGDNSFSERWKIELKENKMFVGEDGKRIEEFWNIHLRPGNRNRALSDGLDAIASAADKENAECMVVVGGPATRFGSASPTARHIRVLKLDSKSKVDTSACSRVLGEALHILSFISGMAADKVNESKDGVPSLATMWKTCKRSLLVSADVIESVGASFAVHPSCFAYEESLKTLVSLVINKELDKLDNPDTIIELITKVDRAWSLVFPENPTAKNIVPPSVERESDYRRRVNEFVNAQINDDGGDGAESKSGGAGDEMDLPPSMMTRTVPNGAETRHAAFRFTAGRIFAEEEKRKRKVWQVARDQYALDIESQLPNPSAPHEHPALQQFDSTQWVKHTHILRLSKLYSEYENIIKAIFRRRVLSKRTADSREDGDMEVDQFVKIMALLDAAHESNIGKYDHDTACAQTAAFLSELYYAETLDIPKLLSTGDLSRPFNHRISLTSQSVNHFIIDYGTLPTRADDNKTSLIHCVADTAAQLQYIIVKCGDQWFDNRVSQIPIVQELLNSDRLSSVYGTKKSVHSLQSLHKLAVQGAGRNLGAVSVGGDIKEDIAAEVLTAADVRAMLYVMTLDDGEFWRLSCHYNLAPSLGIMGLRPHQTYIMMSMVYMAAYGAAGWTFEGKQDFQLGEDAYRKMIFGNFTMYGKPIVLNKEAVTHGLDIFSKGHVRGNGIEVWDPNDPEDVARYQRGDMDKDIFYVYVPINWRPKTWYFDITGHLTSDMGGTRTGEPSWPNAKEYSNFWGWRALSSFMNRPLSDPGNNYGFYGNRNLYRNNTLVFQDVQMWQDKPKSWGIVRKNKGPWGDKVMPGTGKARRGEEMCLPTPTYLERASITITAS